MYTCYICLQYNSWQNLFCVHLFICVLHESSKLYSFKKEKKKDNFFPVFLWIDKDMSLIYPFINLFNPINIPSHSFLDGIISLVGIFQFYFCSFEDNVSLFSACLGIFYFRFPTRILSGQEFFLFIYLFIYLDVSRSISWSRF